MLKPRPPLPLFLPHCHILDVDKEQKRKARTGADRHRHRRAGRETLRNSEGQRGRMKKRDRQRGARERDTEASEKKTEGWEERSQGDRKSQGVQGEGRGPQQETFPDRPPGREPPWGSNGDRGRQVLESVTP